MGITISQALSIGGLKDGVVLAGKENLDNLIEQVNVIETVSGADWSGTWDVKNHLLLTTFNAVHDDLKQQIALLDILYKSQCAGLVFQPTVIPALSPEIIQHAEELGLPIIQIPPDVLYPAVIMPIIEAILNVNVTLLERSQNIHRRFIDLILEGDDLSAVIMTLSEIIQKPVLAVDLWGNRIKAPKIEYSFEDDEISFFPERKSISDYFDPEKYPKNSQDAYEYEQGYYRMPIISGPQDRMDGYLIVLSGSGDLDPMDFIAIEHASAAAALDFAKKRAVIEAERNLRRDFISELLGENQKLTALSLARARSLGWDLSDKRVVILIDLDNFENYYESLNKFGEHRYLQTKEILFHTVEKVIFDQNPLNILVDTPDSLILLPNFDAGIDRYEMRNIIQILSEAILSSIEVMFSGLIVKIAIGGFYNSIEDLSKSYQESKKALHTGLTIVPEQSIYWCEDLAVYTFLNHPVLETEAIKLMQRVLNPLIEYDRSNSTELVRTLEVYLDSNLSGKLAAQKLFIHQKTMKYRLDRIIAILGLNPFLNGRQFLYHLCTKLANIYRT